jgi:hypothetical protein
MGLVLAAVLAGPSVAFGDDVAGRPLHAALAGQIGPGAILAGMGLKGGRVVPVAAGRVAGSATVTILVDMGREAAPRVATFDMEPYALRSPDFRVMVSGAEGELHEVAAPAPATFHGRDRATGDEVWASVIDGKVRGVVFPAAGGEAIAYIQPVSDAPVAVGAGEAVMHVVYGPSDVIATEHECGLDHCPSCMLPGSAGQAGFGPRGPGCKYVETIAEADYPFYQANGNSAAATVQDIETVMLGVNALYAGTGGFTSPVRFALKQVTVWATNAGDPYNALPLIEANSSTMLNTQSSRWAAIASPVHDIVHLFTGRDLNGATVGLAWVGGMCSNSNGYSLAQSRFTTVLAARYTDSAHELGHNFGMQHDAGSGFIMSASVNPATPPTAFSAASITAYNTNIASYACLNNTWTDALPDWAQTLPGNAVTIDVLANDGQGSICTAPVASFTLPSSATALGGTVSVSVGTGPGGRNQVAYTPPAAAAGVEDSFNYTAGGVTVPVYVTVVAPRPPDQPYQSVVSGVSAKYYDISSNGGTSVTLFSTMPDLTTYPQFATGTNTQINFAPSTVVAVGSTRNFAVGAIFDGYIQVPQTAFYQFWLVSDDLSRLFVGSTLVVDNRSVQATGEATGIIALAPGRHQIHLDYTQYTGNSTLVLSYAYGAQSRVTVPASALWRPIAVCHADYDGLGGVAVQDIFTYLNDWFAALPRADFNGVDGLTIQDIFDYLNVWFGAC